AFTPKEAIRIATYDGAYFHGLDRELGSISKGKLADLVVLNRDPLQDIRHTLDIAYVMKGGRLYDANTLDQIWPEKRVYAPLGRRCGAGLQSCSAAGIVLLGKGRV